jgi:hypothetical protein
MSSSILEYPFENGRALFSSSPYATDVGIDPGPVPKFPYPDDKYPPPSGCLFNEDGPEVLGPKKSSIFLLNIPSKGLIIPSPVGVFAGGLDSCGMYMHPSLAASSRTC